MNLNINSIIKELLQNTDLVVDLNYQPPNSPDFNVLDLGFFSSIQSLQQKIKTKSIDELIDAVNHSFVQLEPKKLSNVFLTLQSIHLLSIGNLGGNNYKFLIFLNKNFEIRGN